MAEIEQLVAGTVSYVTARPWQAITWIATFLGFDAVVYLVLRLVCRWSGCPARPVKY